MGLGCTLESPSIQGHFKQGDASAVFSVHRLHTPSSIVKVGVALSCGETVRALAPGLFFSTRAQSHMGNGMNRLERSTTGHPSTGETAGLNGPTSRIQIKHGGAGRLMGLLPYSSEHGAKIKTVVGRRWHQQEQCWTVPHTNEAITHLLTLFDGEPTEVDPSLRPVNGPHRGASTGVPVVCPIVPGDHPLLDQVRMTARTRHLSRHTEQAYCHWVKRFMSFHELRPVGDMGEPEIGLFLSSLATASHVSASTQNQALNALLFLYHKVPERKIGLIQGVVRAKRAKRLPVVLTKEEVGRLLGCLQYTPWLMAMLLYGGGLRLMECCCLRVKDLDLPRTQILVRGGKGDKDRYRTLPTAAPDSPSCNIFNP